MKLSNKQTKHSEHENDSQQKQSATMTKSSPVNVWNEWDPLEEVIVGTALGASTRMLDHFWDYASHVPGNKQLYRRFYHAQPAPVELVSKAEDEIDGFIKILEREGVTVRRPSPADSLAAFATPYWSEKSGYNVMNPRDLLLVIGDQIIEAPSAWRHRYFETFAYRPLIQEYYQNGARWSAAPRPMLRDELYDPNGIRSEPDSHPRTYLTREDEPVFDAASFIRCGRDIIAQRDQCTNLAGIEWLQRHLGTDFKIHIIENKHNNPIHIDNTFVPLAPGRALVHPLWLQNIPEALSDWELLVPEIPAIDPKPNMLGLMPSVSPWISLNVLSLDEKHVCVEASATELIRQLKGWGFTPIPIPYTAPTYFGGSFHCTTLDIRRRGSLKSYC
ncbi:hypothetical protein [Gynuella sunshinyii]|uniref:N-Dimethylarginine dimethylaminohydrolase n=1 Tax=Gynuella sunshinyii YC6258 TaxID=1445510 RepID=A0A0C5VGN2_9GAMM|nr:hypothetical protein [Gynuella sunshinyii]AJQ93361.1 N-Dimethylarginine dimethylaminohydrolase [Gynuella sunshinyii YC6258]